MQLLLQFGVLTVFGALFDMTDVRGKSLFLGVSLDSVISFDNSRNQIIEKVDMRVFNSSTKIKGMSVKQSYFLMFLS